MRIETTPLDGVVIIHPDVFGDARGFFLETYHRDKYREAGINVPFVQDNHSYSTQGILRGLHCQYRKPQGKLVWVLQGEVFDVAVDVRANSRTYGQWFGTILSGDNFRRVYIPPGYAHGFLVLSESAHFLYKCTDVYDAGGELTIMWDDPALSINWPSCAPQVSDKDRNGMSLAQASRFLLQNTPCPDGAAD